MSAPTPTQAAARARLALFVAALCPIAIWPVSGGVLARPLETAAWALLCALLAATAPGRLARLSAYLLCLLLPLTLAWIGAVASTGMGPSITSLESVSAGAFKEVRTALIMVLGTPGFQWIAGLTVLATLLAARLAHRHAWPAPRGWAGLPFLVLLVPASASVLDAAGLRSFGRFAGPEARISVPWLSHLETLKAGLTALAARHLRQPGDDATPIRSATDVTATFRTEPGVALLIVGESLRADALLQPGRGPGSNALLTRIANGLGTRLPDTCAGGNSTFVSVPKLLTAAPGDVNAPAPTRPSLLALARAGGARSAYINNHEGWVMPETGHDLVQKISSTETSSLDEVAIEAAENFIRREQRAPSLALVVHLYGQHFFYQDRYPRTLFGPEPDFPSAEAQETFRYQRAAEYGALVLARAAQLLDSLDTPAYLVFTSDHGENLLDDRSGRHFHAGPVSSRQDTLVPALVLWNRAFAASGRPQRLAPLRNAGLISHRDVARAWLALQGAPDLLAPTAAPMTWGALNPGEASGPLRCATLIR